jgi:hypothetical protein
MPTQKFRGSVLIVLLVLLAPVAASGLMHEDLTVSEDGNRRVNDIPAEDVTFVSAQGKEFPTGQARLVAFDTATNKPIWMHSKYDRYMDVDPLGPNRVLFVARDGSMEKSAFSFDVTFYAIEMNWRTGEVLRKFEIPPGTHDIDYLGGDRYAIADLSKDNRVFVYDRSEDEVVWEYRFRNHFPKSAGGGPGGYTHLNDIDAVDNGSAFLVSPRNFDRVMLIDRGSKRIRWTLGEEDNYDILNEQHNPVLLSQDPVTVLVADSENNRVVEYERTKNGWNRTWTYGKGLDWPRDADRLPNGNTLIVDSNNNRALEVTPGGDVVWDVDIPFEPYDVERPVYGDEPSGPTMSELEARNDVGRNGVERKSDRLIDRLDAKYMYVYTTAQWVLPTWVGPLEFTLLVIAALIIGVWGTVEVLHWRNWTLRRRMGLRDDR